MNAEDITQSVDTKIQSPIYIEENPDLDPSKNINIDQITPTPTPPPSITFNIHQPRWNCPKFGTTRWTDADYGLGVSISVPIDGLAHKRFIGIVDYAFSTLGFNGNPGYGNFLKLTTDMPLWENIRVTVKLQGLLAYPTTNSYGELLTGISWLEEDTNAPWKGLYGASELLMGTNGNQGWFTALGTILWNLHIIPDTIMFAPSFSIMTTLLDTTPNLRLPTVQAGYGFQARDLGTGIPDPLYSGLSAASLTARLKGSIALGSPAMSDNSTVQTRLNMSLGPWVAAKNFVHRNDNFPISFSSGMAATVGLAMDVTTHQPQYSRRVITPILTLELQVPFNAVINPSKWTLTLLTLLDPSTTIRM